MKENEYQLATSCHQTKLPVLESGYRDMGNLWYPKTIQTVVKTVGCWPQINSKVPLLKTTPKH